MDALIAPNIFPATGANPRRQPITPGPSERPLTHEKRSPSAINRRQTRQRALDAMR